MFSKQKWQNLCNSSFLVQGFGFWFFFCFTSLGIFKTWKSPRCGDVTGLNRLTHYWNIKIFIKNFDRPANERKKKAQILRSWTQWDDDQTSIKDQKCSQSCPIEPCLQMCADVTNCPPPWQDCPILFMLFFPTLWKNSGGTHAEVGSLLLLTCNMQRRCCICHWSLRQEEASRSPLAGNTTAFHPCRCYAE